MQFAALSSLFVVTAINAVIPGPVVLMIISRSATVSRASGLKFVAGVLLARLVTLAAVLPVLATSSQIAPEITEGFRAAGFCLLIILSIRMWQMPRPASNCPPTSNGYSTVSDTVTGFLTGLFNPFNLTLMTILLPSILDFSDLATPDLFFIATTLCIATALPLCAIACIGTSSKPQSRRHTVYFSRLGAALLMAFAINSGLKMI